MAAEEDADSFGPVLLATKFSIGFVIPLLDILFRKKITKTRIFLRSRVSRERGLENDGTNDGYFFETKSVDITVLLFNVL